MKNLQLRYGKGILRGFTVLTEPSKTLSLVAQGSGGGVRFGSTAPSLYEIRFAFKYSPVAHSSSLFLGRGADALEVTFDELISFLQSQIVYYGKELANSYYKAEEMVDLLKKAKEADPLLFRNWHDARSKAEKAKGVISGSEAEAKAQRVKEIEAEAKAQRVKEEFAQKDKRAEFAQKVLAQKAEAQAKYGHFCSGATLFENSSFKGHILSVEFRTTEIKVRWEKDGYEDWKIIPYRSIESGWWKAE